MPELPEVETVRAALLAGGLPDRVIRDVAINWDRTVGGDPAGFKSAVIGRRFRAVKRRGKYLIIELDNGNVLLVHLRMSGRLYIAPAEAHVTGYERLTLKLDNGEELRFYDPRKFGRAELHPDLSRSPVAQLAPEPLGREFTASYVADYTSARRRMLKPLLLDQRALVAGMGNIYVDEALWEAQLHPCKLSNELTKGHSKRLHEAVRKVIEKGIRNAGTSLGSGNTNFKLPTGPGGRNQEQLNVFRRTDEPCPRCESPIVRLKVGQRSTHVCPACQRL